MSRLAIGTKILLVVGVVFVLFTIGLAMFIGATGFNNLAQVKQAELDRTSQILAGQIAQMERDAAEAALRFDESGPLITEIKLLTDRGPYYADPGSYFEADFVGAGAEIENADKIYVFQSQLELIQLLLSVQQSNRFSSISFYHLSPFEVVADAPPLLSFRLGEEAIILSQFQHRGKTDLPRFYTIETAAFQPPAPDYFDISSAYAFPPEDFYRENNFVLTPDVGDFGEEFAGWREAEEPVSEIRLNDGAPVIRTWYPVRAGMAHPETWAEEMVTVGIIQIEQILDDEAVTALAEQLGLDIALTHEDRLLISSLQAGESPTAGEQLQREDDVVVINQSAFNYASQEIAFAEVATGLRAVVLSPLSELEGPTSVLRQRIIQLAVITVLLAGILIYLILFYLLNRPLGALMDGVHQISRGDLHHAVAVSSRDEMGQLAMAFNGMAEQLRDLIGSLEQRVVERTRELTAANREAEMARQKAETANQAKSEFLSHMSHELRTPLNGILGYAQILHRNGDLNPQQANGLTIIQQSGEHLLTLINDVLDMTRIEAQKMELFLTDVELHKLLNDLVNIFQLRAEQKGLQFDYEASPDLPFAIHVDDKRLRQILINLLSNAIRYTKQGRVTFRTVRLDRRRTNGDTPGDWAQMADKAPEDPPGNPTVLLRFEVKDTGIGMTQDAIRDIFIPFEQLGEPSQRERGSGLGLTISQNLAHMMGSEILVESAPGVGSSFWFDLTAPVAQLVPQPDVGAVRAITGYRGRRRTILSVDDNAYNRSLITDLLKPLGFTMIEAANGADAVALAAAHSPDLIFMDLRMADMSGFDAIRTIREQQPSNRPVIIAASASAFEVDRQRSREAGGDGFLAKPVQAPLLFELLEQHLDLEWLYGPAFPTGDRDGAPAAADDGAFAVPPAEELDALMSLAQQGMMRGIREQADHLVELDPQYAPLAEHLRTLAQQFREKEIIALLGQLSSARQPTSP